MRKTIPVICLVALVGLGAIVTNREPLFDAFLQSNLDGNQKTITNLNSSMFGAGLLYDGQVLSATELGGETNYWTNDAVSLFPLLSLIVSNNTGFWNVNGDISANATNHDWVIGQGATNDDLLFGLNGTNQSLLIGFNATNDDLLFGLGSTNESLLMGLNATNNDTVISNGVYAQIDQRVATNDSRQLVLSGTTNNLGQNLSGQVVWATPIITNTTSGLTNWWTFDEASGTNAADSIDSSAGTFIGSPTWTNGQINSALVFSSSTTTGLQLATNTGVGTGAFSVAMWIYPSNNNGCLIYDSDNNFTAGYFLQISFGPIYLQVVNSGANTKRQGGKPLLNTWTHVVVTWDGTLPGAGIHIFTNAVEVADYDDTRDGSGSHVANTTSTRNIAKGGASDTGYIGMMDDVRVYSRVLSIGEISNIYQWRPPGFIGDGSRITGLTNSLETIAAATVISQNATNEALRQAISITNGAINNLSNYALTISQNATNQSLKIGANATNDDLLFGLNSTNESLLIGSRATNNDTVISQNATNEALLIGSGATNQATVVSNGVVAHTVTVAGTADQITSSVGTGQQLANNPSTVMALANPLLAPGPVSSSSITNTGSFMSINGLLYSWPSTQTGGNLFDDGAGNLTWVAGTNVTIPNTITLTNFILNQRYTNNSGSIQIVDATVALITTGVSGNSSLDLMVDQSGGSSFSLQDRSGINTLITGLTQNYTNNLSGALSNNATYYFTNSSNGAGDSAVIVPGTGEIITLADGTAANVANASTTITVNGTANQITSSAGAQTLAANRTWTLSLPSPLIAPGPFSATTLTNGASAGSRIQLTDASKKIIDAAASGAVPIDADGSATSSSQINALFPANILTNNYTSVIVLSNALKLDAGHALSLSNLTTGHVLQVGADSTISSVSSAAVPIDGDGTATTSSQVNALFPSNIVTNNYTSVLVLSNAVKLDATHALSLSNLTTGHVLQVGADSTVSSVSSAAVPIDGDGTATTSAQVNALFPGIIVTNNGTTAIIYSNAWIVDAAHGLSAGTITNKASAGSKPQKTDANGKIVDGTIDVSSADITGVLAASAFPALNGDVTTSAGNLTTTLAVGKARGFQTANTGNVLIPASTTIFLPLNNSSTNALLWTADASGGTRSLCPSQTKFRNMYVVASVNPGTAKCTITLMTNGVASSITCGPSGGTTANDTTHTETVIAGVEAGWKIVIGASATSAKYVIAVETDL